MNQKMLVSFFILCFLYLFLKYGFIYCAPFLFAYLLARVITQLEGNINKAIFFYILILFILFLLIIFLVFTLYQSMKTLYLNFDALSVSLQSVIQQFPFIQTYASLFPQIYSFLFSSLSSLILSFPKILGYLFLILFLTFLFLLDIHAPARVIQKLSFSTYEKLVSFQSILFETCRKMLLTNLILFLMTGAESWLGYMLTQTSHPFLMALLTACCDFLPMIGSGIILYPYAFYYLIQKEMNKAILLFVTGIVISILRFFIEPKLTAHQLKIPLLLHLFMMLVCVQLFGFLGFFYSPFLCTLLVLWYEKKTNGHIK